MIQLTKDARLKADKNGFMLEVKKIVTHSGIGNNKVKLDTPVNKWIVYSYPSNIQSGVKSYITYKAKELAQSENTFSINAVIESLNKLADKITKRVNC